MKLTQKITILLTFLILLTSVSSAYEVKSGKKNPSANDFVEQQILGKKYPGGTMPLPYFFNVPKNVQLNLGSHFDSDDVVFDYYHSLTKNKNDGNQIGLRLVMINNAQDRKVTAENLAASGLVQDGDVLLTFHPEWAGTGPYPSLMTGISHSGMAFIHDGKVQNIDMPLNEEQNFQEGTKRRSYLNSDHYINYAPFIHILRPRITAAEKKNLSKWAETFYERVRGTTSGKNTVYPYPLKFNSNYLNPAYLLHRDLGNTQANLTAHVLDLGRSGSGERKLRNLYLNVESGQASRTLPLFCSDFVWSLHALRDCYVGGMDRCRPDPMFKPIGLIGTGGGTNYAPGSTDAALLLLQAMDEKNPAKVSQMIDQVFKKKFNYQNISSGHKKAAAAIDERLYTALAMYWKAKLSGSHREAANIATQLNNSGMPKNYAPTTFLINALLPNDSHAKKYDYVATIAFVGKRNYNKFENKLFGNGSTTLNDPQTVNIRNAEIFNLNECMNGGGDYEDYLVGLLKKGDFETSQLTAKKIRQVRCSCKNAIINAQEIDVCQQVKAQQAKHGLSWVKFVNPQ